MSVIISWLAYFISSGCDTLVVSRTTPTQRWINPNERVMSVLNLALSNCAVAREMRSDEFEKHMKKCNIMASVRKMAKQLNGGAEVTAIGVLVGVDATVSAVPITPPLVSNANEDPVFDIDEELRDHMIENESDEDNLPLDESMWNDDGNADVFTGVDNNDNNNEASDLGNDVVEDDAEINVLLQVLRKISPMIENALKIDSSNINKHPKIQKCIDNHTRGSAYFRQFFKQPLVANCDCVPCRNGMFFVNSMIS